MDANIPYYEQWTGPWAMLPEAFYNTFELFRRLDLHLHLEQQLAQPIQAAAGSLTQTAGQVAVISLTGKLMKQRASMGGGTSTVEARRDIRAAARDPDVSAILLRIDSPGGTAAGTKELADDIAAAAAKKPVHTYIEDMAASAAYWAASRSTMITANATAIVGSIGTYGVVHDMSGAAAMQGVKVHVIRAGEHKGVGTPGTEITADHLADMQRLVDQLNDHFLEGVAAGRGMNMDAVKALADGRAYLAADALKLGLIDSIGTFEQALAALQTTTKRSKTMQASLPAESVDAALSVDVSQEAPPAAPVKQEQPKPQPANYAELKAGLPGADAAFLCSQLEASATLATAQAAWMAEQNRRIEAAKQRPGVEAVGTRPGENSGVDEGAIANWESLVAAEMAAGKNRANAVKACVKNNREAHLAYLAAHNAQVRR